MWHKIKRGEEKNIFVYQEEADVMFNSTLVYELCVLKKYALEELNKIKEDNIEISIVLYTSITEYNKFLNIKQEININILKILEAEGIKLAYPGRNVYVQK